MAMKRKRRFSIARGTKRAKALSVLRPRFGLMKTAATKVQQSLRAIMKYCDLGIGLNPGVGATAATYVYAANGLYDPNITGVGHQPTGFDQLMAMYNEYVVLGATIKVVFSNLDNANPAVVGIALLDFSTTGTDIRQYVENGQNTWTCLSERGGGKDITTLTLKADIRKFSTQDILAADGFSGNVSANPADTHYFHIFAGPADNSTDMGIISCTVEVTYDCVFRDNSFTALS